MSETSHQRAEAELMAYALALPETDVAIDWGVIRTLRVARKSFAVFGAMGEPSNALSLTIKLPISFEMVQGLYYVRESHGWYRQHQWAIAHFGPDDDIQAELDTLKGWLRQGYVAQAPKRLSRQLDP